MGLFATVFCFAYAGVVSWTYVTAREFEKTDRNANAFKTFLYSLFFPGIVVSTILFWSSQGMYFYLADQLFERRSSG